MNIWKFLLWLWASLTLVSLAIDAVCVWVDAHGWAQRLLEAWGVNYITLFLWSAPAPLALAILLLMLGACLGIMGWIARIFAPRRAPLIGQTQRRRYGAAARKDAA